MSDVPEFGVKTMRKARTNGAKKGVDVWDGLLEPMHAADEEVGPEQSKGGGRTREDAKKTRGMPKDCRAGLF